MKRLLASLALAALVGGAVVVLRNSSTARPPPPLGVIRVECDGNFSCCTGTGSTAQGPRQFVYRVKIPGGNLNLSVSSVEVGIHDPTLADYQNLVMPAGWSLSILSATRPDPGFHCTSHGSISSINGSCPYVLRFAGPAQTSSFELAYDFAWNYDVHDADWKAGSNSANWTMAVGLGHGPVHSPMIP